MNAATIAGAIADFLEGRDDIASADAVENEVRIVTQGGQAFYAVVADA